MIMIMKMKKYILSILAIGLLLMACEDPYKNSTYQVYDVKPVSTYLSSDSTFSEWVKIMKFADMYNALNQADQDFTAFVPTNDAVERFFDKMGVDSIQQLGKDYARSMIQYHTVLDTISVEDFIMLDYTTNISGDKLYIEIDSVNPGEAIMNGEARVTKMGISTYNGLIYVLDDVMKPLVETVYDRVAKDSRYSIFAEAVRNSGWDDDLDKLADTVLVDGTKTINKYFYTLLAVSDDAYKKDGINSFSSLVSKLGAGSDYQNSANELNKYIAYHVIKSAYKLEDLKKFPGSDTSVIWGTEAENQVLMITWDKGNTGKYYLNLMGTKAEFVETKSNVLSKNGYLHEIDSYLPVWEPQQTTVIWDLADYPDVRDKVGPAIFQPSVPVGSEDKISLVGLPCYTYEVSPSGVGGQSYSYLTYVTCKTNLKNAYHYDRLVLNLGYMGSVSMKTPTLVRGKYKVSVSFIYLTDHVFMKNMTDGNGGMMKLSFDGANFKNASPYTTVSSTLTGVYESTLYDEIEFNSTTSHDFKITVMDPSASTNSKFSIQIDCITFTPITE